MYQITTNGYFFGLSLYGKEVLPCNNNRLWRLTADLVGFRQGDWCGLYSLEQEKVVHEPTIVAVLPYFKQVRDPKESLPVRPRVHGEYGDYEKHKIYLERCDYLLWKDNSLKLMTTDGVVFIDRRDGLLRSVMPNHLIQKSRKDTACNCIYEDEYGMPTLAKVSDFRYQTVYDEQMDETRYLESAADLDLEDDEEAPDDDDEFPEYKVYDYDAIPAVIKDKLLKHVGRLTNNKASAWLAKVLIFYTWCHANGYVSYDERGEFEVDPMYSLPPEEAAHIFDATMLYESHHMAQFEHLLYLSPVTNIYYDVLAIEN